MDQYRQLGLIEYILYILKLIYRCAMPLFVRDEKIDLLMLRLEKRLGLNKTDVVRRALNLLDTQSAVVVSLAEQVALLQARARSEGLSGRPFDDKELMDDLSGGI